VTSEPVRPATDPAVLLESELVRLAPALQGYPVEDLVAEFMPRQGDTHAYRLVDSCLRSWIQQLDDALASLPADLEPDVLRAVEDRQRETHDALRRISSLLRQVDSLS
jgi:hypothetical protein